MGALTVVELKVVQSSNLVWKSSFDQLIWARLG